jgi:CBS domain-containing protein
VKENDADPPRASARVAAKRHVAARRENRLTQAKAYSRGLLTCGAGIASPFWMSRAERDGARNGGFRRASGEYVVGGENPAASGCDISTIMRRDVITAAPDFSIETVADALLHMDTGGLPIVDVRKRPIGFVTLLDVMREWHLRGDDEDREPRSIRLRDLRREATEPGLHGLRTARATVGEIMTPLVLTLPLGACITDAASAMHELGLRCLVVVDGARAVCGMITTEDVTRWVAQLTPNGPIHGKGCPRLHDADRSTL